LRHTVGGNIGYHTENHGKNKGGKKGLYDYPKRSENGLLVGVFEVTTHKERDEVTIFPKLTKIEIKQTAL
jgi:hypothetical protein